MKIYTKTGDEGTTALFGGKRVKKYNPRIEAYGTVDELNSFIGLVRDQHIEKGMKEVLLTVQERLFTLGAALAADPEKLNLKKPDLLDADIELLEQEMDKMDAVLPELKNFILPGGHTAVSYCHIARCVCRRAERLVVQLSEGETVAPIILIYLNRLSDYLFVCSRKIAFDLKVEEIPWKPRG